MISILYLTLTWKSESLVAKTLKSSMAKKAYAFFTDVDSFDFDFFAVKGEAPECLSPPMLKCQHVSP